jgi:hypothetical protein
MKHMNRFLSLIVFSAAIVGLFGVSLSVVQARSNLTHTHTTVFVTARVQDKWGYDGNLYCESATLETEGQTYVGVIKPGNWRGHSGSESCFIAFSDVPTPLSASPAKVTVKYASLVGGETAESVSADRLQTQEKEYIQELASYDDHVVLDDMILEDGSTNTVSLTARVSNKWWVVGNLHCVSATLEAQGQTYVGAVSNGAWSVVNGNKSCYIAFNNVATPAGSTPAVVTVRFYSLVGDETIELVTADRLQSQSKNYFLVRARVNDPVVLEDMLLDDNSKTPVIEIDPNDTILPDLPAPSELPIPVVPGL